MKKLLIIPVVVGGLATAAISCSPFGGSKAPNALDENISEFEISQKLIKGERDYKLDTDFGTVYLELSSSVLWPEKLGMNDIKVLQDSLLAIAFNYPEATSVREALEHFLTDTESMPEADAIARVDSVPSDSLTYFNNLDVSVIELEESFITYSVESSVYMGGAHPISSIYPFTYDLTQGKILTFENIFKPDVKPETILPFIKQSIAYDNNVRVNNLEQAGLFSSDFTDIGLPYIKDDALYFHYNPYLIAPYSSGMIDVAVYPYDIKDYLRPEVMALFDE